MTANQIAYQNYLENARANRAKESENVRHNQAAEYNQLIGALNNVFSLGAHAAQGSSNITEGLKNQITSAFGEKSPVTTIFSGITDSLTSNSSKPVLESFKEIFGPITGEPTKKILESDLVKAIKDKVVEVKDKVTDKFSDIADNIRGKITSIFQ